MSRRALPVVTKVLVPFGIGLVVTLRVIMSALASLLTACVRAGAVLSERADARRRRLATVRVDDMVSALHELRTPDSSPFDGEIAAASDLSSKIRKPAA